MKRKQPKTFQDALKFLRKFWQEGKPIIIQEKDYLWVRKAYEKQGPIHQDQVITFNGSPIYFDTIKTKEKEVKLACRWCNKKTGVIKFYIIADNLEEPKPYHPACIRKLEIEVMMKLSDSKAQI